MRVFLNGEGEPIPLEALPIAGSSAGDFVLDLTTGVFVPADYVALGFAYYEAWCIGAAGGRGGDSSVQVIFDSTVASVTMTTEQWNLWLELIRIQDYFTSGEWDHIYLYSDGHEPSMRTAVQQEMIWNPRHLMQVATYTAAHIDPRNQYYGMGGSGGGGGLHVVSGNLADLPASVPVVVGVSGTDAGYGQTVARISWVPLPESFGYVYASSPNPTENRLHQLYNYFRPLQQKYPPPRTSIPVPTVGQDGGVSSFGGTICRASGGKGGQPGRVWDHHDSSVPYYPEVFLLNGAGGDGGAGNRSVAGGGGAGGAGGDDINGSDGTWDGTIGKGGGGGRGYGYNNNPGGSLEFGPPPATIQKPSNGGQGAYSFADTSVFGPREFKSTHTGGGGGGAHLGARKFGSHALGYSPNGAVLLRIFKPE